MRIAFAVAWSIWATSAIAGSEVLYAPPADWVKPVQIPAAPSVEGDQSIQPLLLQVQTRLDGDGDKSFFESAFRILSPQGLSVVAGITPSWNPDTETLTLHRFNVIRDGQTIDLLQGGKKVTVLRRETRLEQATLDGSLTATLQPEGLKVGDIVDFAATSVRRDPVLKGHSQAFFELTSPTPVARILVRETWPVSKPIRWKITDAMPAPTVTQSPAGTELVVDLANVSAPKQPSDAPVRFQNLGQLQISQFDSWADVSTLMYPLYEKASTLGAGSPLKLEAKKIAQATSDPRIRVAAALRIVQDQVRYAYIGLNFGGYIPADADLTWTRRFGDCKGKTALLLALLKELGIQAEPALVNSTNGDGLSSRLPTLAFFDHVIVRAQIGKDIYWLDGTRLGDRAIDDIAVPDFHWALPVLPTGAQLTPLQPTPLDKPEFESTLRLDATAGLEAKAPAHAEHILRGDDAVSRNIALTGAGAVEAERDMRSYWRGIYPWIDAKNVSYTFDDAHRVMRLSMDGVATMDWDQSGAFRDFQVSDSSIGMNRSFRREPGPHDDAPFSVPYPLYKSWKVVINLPNKGEGFQLLNGADVDRTVAGRHNQRHAEINDGVVTILATEKTVVPEFPADEADAAARTLRQMANYDVMVRTSLTSNSVGDDAGSADPEPTTAAEFAFRGARLLRKHEFDKAIADFDRAIVLDPKSARDFYNRAVAHFHKGEDGLALADFSKAIELNPTDGVALDGRAQLYLLTGRDLLADADIDRADHLAQGDAGALRLHAALYEVSGHYLKAIGFYDQLVAKAPTVEALNGRCWARAEWGKELTLALADCDAALKLGPGTASVLDSRGLVLLRQGRYADAISSYDDALRARPGQAESLFGRGLARLRGGSRTEADVDLAAARAAKAGIDSEFARFGVAP